MFSESVFHWALFTQTSPSPGALSPPLPVRPCLGHLQIECSFGLGAAASVALRSVFFGGREGSRRGMEEGEMYDGQRGRESVK